MPIFLPDSRNIERASQLLRAGEIVAFPTETVYGLGADALNAQAVQKIFDAKERPSYNPLIVHVSSEEEARRLVTFWPLKAQLLAAAFWPGALSLVLPKRATVPDSVTAGLANVALRSPSHPVARALLEAADLPIAAPSANRFTELSPTSATHVENALGSRVSMILDGGNCVCGIESTVLDLSRDVPVLLRPGSVSRAQIEEIIGEIRLRADIEYSMSDETPRLSPGQIERHYAPRATLIAFDDIADLGRLAAPFSALRCGALCFGSSPPSLRHARQMPHNCVEYARQLYGVLHELDDLGCDLIFVENVPHGSEWDGVRDRLKRAATPREKK